MRGPSMPYKELTSAANENVLGTLTPRAWHLLNVARVRAKILRQINKTKHMSHEEIVAAQEAGLIHTPAELLAQYALATSGSIGGAHRRDLKEALMGQQLPKMGLVGPMELNGHTERQEAQRGL